MYCVVCVQNRASDFFCPFCQGNIGKLLRKTQIEVTKDWKDIYQSLTMEQQHKIASLISKRILSGLKAGIYNESDFRVDTMVKEYCEMTLKRHEYLEIPISTDYSDMNGCRYTQYTSPRGD